MSETTGMATYSPEDNKLRLYVGRVPREEFLKLRDEGWTCTPKQRENGGCDFVATWTPRRRDTALEYGGGVIEDEDQPMAERAADRAERFGGYRDKRTDEATEHADRYDSQPTAHGFQSHARAERAAARHDRIADRACDAWSKAEYWQQRTAGVISHALHKSLPGVRMGRIKVLEAELRKHEKSLNEYAALYRDMQKIAAIADPDRQTQVARQYLGSRNVWAEYLHPRAETHPREYRRTNKTSLYSLISDEQEPITGAEACALFFSNHHEPKTEDDFTRHCKLRLLYENQMLEAQGGRLEQKDIEVGGKIGGMLILKVNKSSVTKRATSVSVLKREKLQGWCYKGANIPGTDWSEHQIDTERVSPGAYVAPTAESLAEFAEVRAAIKGGTPKTATIPLINPTDEDAERLQALWNAKAKAEHDKRNTYTSESARAMHDSQFKLSEVCRLTQVQYSANSGGTYSPADARAVFAGGIESGLYYGANEKMREKHGREVCKVRRTSGGNYQASRVIILTDKPQKPLPAALWAAKPETVAA